MVHLQTQQQRLQTPRQEHLRMKALKAGTKIRHVSLHNGAENTMTRCIFTAIGRICDAVSRAVQARSAELLRLGLLMALTMTLHNFPEGFAVSFQLCSPVSFTVH